MRHAFALLPLIAGCTTIGVTPRAAPFADYHQHLVSRAFAPIAKLPERDGAALVRELDAAGIDRAVVLSVGYSYGDERKALNNPDRLTREENDWTSSQIVKNAPRLIGFCSANPLRAAALQELERCLKLPGMVGIKLHMGNAGLTLRNAEHLVQIQQLFALAQRHRAPLLVHMRARGGADYGAEDARIFLDKIIPYAPGIEIIVAHLGASSPGYPAQNDEVMAVFGEAAERGDRRLRNLYVDVSANLTADATPGDLAAITKRVRQLGPKHILYGSDLSPPGGSIRSGWEIFSRMPLTPAEMQIIVNNRPRFLR